MQFKLWLESKTPCGKCYEYAYNLFKSLVEKGENAALVHGIVMHPIDKNQFPHAWVVWNGDIYDWQSNGKKSSRSKFKKLWNPTSIKTYLPNDLTNVLKLLLKTNNYGPWD